MNLALRYRPLHFANVLEQEFVKNYFRNSFATQNLAQVFLFTGTRGIGKTSLARILAKSFNCLAHSQPSFNMCQKCENCLKIDQTNNIDVLEFDAASYTGVNDIRQILESMQYTPATSRYKIYIIDEVHMLSQNAFNALLKTLEEPPKHVIFILATTEMQKIPTTILSRCQIFQLHLPNNNALMQHLCEIAKKEDYILEKNAAAIIVKQSENSVRDGLSLLQQIILTIEEKTITALQVKKILHIIEQDSLKSILTALINGNTEQCLQIFQHLLNEGFNSLHVLKSLLEYVYINIREKQNSFSLKELHHIWQILLKGVQSCKNGSFHKMITEMTLLQIAHIKNFESPQQLVQKIKNPITASNTFDNNNKLLNKSELNWRSIQEKIKKTDLNLYNLMQKYVTNGVINDNKLTLIFDDDHNEENELRALTIKNKIEKIIINNYAAIIILIKFEKRNLQNLTEKIKYNFAVNE